MGDFNIRLGRPEDIPRALELIIELAEYEDAPQEVEVTAEQMLHDGFSDQSVYRFLVAEQGQKIVGLSLFYPRYSTWKGKGMYLEDLIVTESCRGQGIGKRLLTETADIARKENCTALYWQVLDWNTPAVEFYESLGANIYQGWWNCKLVL